MLNKYKMFTGPKGTSRISTSEKDNFKRICDKEANDGHRKGLASRWAQKGEATIQKASQQITKLIQNKNILINKLKEKDEEILRLEDKVSLLLRELSALKTDHLKALEEIKMLKFKMHESARNNEIVEQKNSLYNKMQRELIKSEQLIANERLKAQSLKTLKLNPHRWRTMKYTDPHYFEALQKKNHLQKELSKKINLMRKKDAELNEKNTLLMNMKSMLKRRPYNLMEDPTEQMMEFYKKIQLQKKKIKLLTMQVDMFESVFPNQFHKYAKFIDAENIRH